MAVLYPYVYKRSIVYIVFCRRIIVHSVAGQWFTNGIERRIYFFYRYIAIITTTDYSNELLESVVALGSNFIGEVISFLFCLEFRTSRTVQIDMFTLNTTALGGIVDRLMKIT